MLSFHNQMGGEKMKNELKMEFSRCLNSKKFKYCFFYFIWVNNFIICNVI